MSTHHRARARRRDRGFSLITVFMLMIVMTGTAIGLLIASQSDVNLAGVGREQQMALYAAEYGVARAKGLIAYEGVAMYNATSGWSPLLSGVVPDEAAALCDVNSAAIPNSQPGLLPIGTRWTQPATFYTMADHAGNVLNGQDIKYTYCIHNNADDPAFLQPSGPSGNVDDSRDPQHLIVIESWGYAPNNAQVHLTITVGIPTLNATGGTASYAQEGSGATHTGTGGAAETGVTIATGTKQSNVTF